MHWIFKLPPKVICTSSVPISLTRTTYITTSNSGMGDGGGMGGSEMLCSWKGAGGSENTWLTALITIIANRRIVVNIHMYLA